MNTYTDNKFFSRLAGIYETMDDAWNLAAAHYGFVCNGCDDNCCESEFYHHTFVEKAYLLSGISNLDPAAKKRIQERAKTVLSKLTSALKKGESLRIMCPLNEKGRCILYLFRPMICRLHGIPNELKKPGRTAVKGPGCDAGKELFTLKPYTTFDRTPFYTKMAMLEMDYRKTTEKTGRVNQTIAEMLIY